MCPNPIWGIPAAKIKVPIVDHHTYANKDLVVMNTLKRDLHLIREQLYNLKFLRSVFFPSYLWCTDRLVGMTHKNISATINTNSIEKASSSFVFVWEMTTDFSRVVSDDWPSLMDKRSTQSKNNQQHCMSVRRSSFVAIDFLCLIFGQNQRFPFNYRSFPSPIHRWPNVRRTQRPPTWHESRSQLPYVQPGMRFSPSSSLRLSEWKGQSLTPQERKWYSNTPLYNVLCRSSSRISICFCFPINWSPMKSRWEYSSIIVLV